MSNKYIYAEATVDYWPQFKTVIASSYNNAFDKIIEEYTSDLDHDFTQCEDWEEFREKLNDEYTIALSDLYSIDEL